MESSEVWVAIMATAGGVALAVAIPVIGFGLAFRPWLQSIIKAELSDFKVDVTSELKEIKTKLDILDFFQRSAAIQAQAGLADNPNPPISRKNDLLEKWQLQTLTYEESLELKFILENEAIQANEAKKALIAVALLGIGIYLLTKK